MIVRRLRETDCTYLVELIAIYRQEQDREFSSDQAESARQQFLNLARIQVIQGSEDINRSGPPVPYSLVWVVAQSERPNIPLGYLNSHFGYFPLLGAPELYISDLLIHPDFRGQGLGSKLLAQAEDFANTQGCKRIMLNNLKTDQSYSRGYYLSQGFSERTNVANMVKATQKSPDHLLNQLDQLDTPESLLFPQNYPQELVTQLGITEGMVVGVVNDFGGLLSELILQEGCRVYSLFASGLALSEAEPLLLGYTGSTLALLGDSSIHEAWNRWDLMILCKLRDIESQVEVSLTSYHGIKKICQIYSEPSLTQDSLISWNDGTRNWSFLIISNSSR